VASSNDLPLEDVPEVGPSARPHRVTSARRWIDRRRVFIAGVLALFVAALFVVFLNASRTAVSNGRNLNELNSGLSEDQEANRSYSLGMSRWDAATEQNLLAAIPEFENAIRHDPKFVAAYSDLADTYALIGHYECSGISATDAMKKAAEFAHIALTLDPADSKARTSLALIAARNNQLNESIALLDESIGFNPVNSIPYQRKAWLFASIGQNEKALELMKTAYRIAPRSRSINYGIASLLNISDLPLESLEFSRRWLEFDPQNSNARLKIAESLEMIGGYGEALVELQAITEGDAAYAEAEIVKSRILFKIGQIAAARKTLRNALEGPDPTRYGFQIAQTYKTMGDPRSAIHWMSRNPRRDPNLFSFEF
jgi:tetratricopeptide (TPR) repeat protein